MGQEIERKFLVKNDGWRTQAVAQTGIVQAYVALGERASVRLRILNDERAVLTIKSREASRTRLEYEYSIPIADAHAMLPLRQGALIEKTRTTVRQGDLTWEIDVFGAPFSGLVLAEVELDRADRDVDLPRWLGREVTDDPRYYNAALAQSGTVPTEREEEADCEA